ncbi:hypothetical protein K7X08_033069 [Anisodus acutangulus]|uniref:Uncharacterized protein n=1 Tax=Anisodus acutangulus TaxID=402998 RepID=A0A9Q1RCW5_9SOLA|nr:hypothetical protein K7X08_033069 [Anisodus acutangulus]
MCDAGSSLVKIHQRSNLFDLLILHLGVGLKTKTIIFCTGPINMPWAFSSLSYIVKAVKEAGEIKMHVGSVAYYQLMLVCQAEYFRQLLKPVT